jgi:hypothetical protein
MPHADIHEQKGMQSYELPCAHKKRSEISEKLAFMDSSHDQCGERFTDAKDIAGLGVHAISKSVLLSPNRGCEKFRPGSEGRGYKMKCSSFFSPRTN